MAAPISTPLPAAPQRNEPESEFIDKANNFVAALEPFRVDLQAQADFVNTNVGPGSDAETVANIAADVSAVAAVAPDVSLLAAGQVSKTELAAAYGNEFWDGWVSEDKSIFLGDNVESIDYSSFGYKSATNSLDIDMLGANDTFRISDAGTVKFTFTGSTGSLLAVGNISAYSDKRLKTNITPLLDSLDKCKELKGYNFKRMDLDLIQDGLLAQDVQKVLPDSVFEDRDGLLSVSYNGIIALLVNCVNELHDRLCELGKNNDSTS